MSFMGLFKKKEPSEDPVAVKFRNMMEEFKYTPDAPILERRYNQFVFVPNEMMSTQPKYDKISQSGFKIGFGFTEDKFTFWKQDAGEHTQAIPMEGAFKECPKARIKGELHLVSSTFMPDLDNYHRNGVEFTRKLIRVLIPYRRAKNYRPHDRAAYEWLISRTQFMGEMTAWMYVGEPEYWNPLLEKGTKLYHTNKKGIKSLTRVNGSGTFSTVSCFQPNNPEQDIYYYFVNAKTRSNDS